MTDWYCEICPTSLCQKQGIHTFEEDKAAWTKHWEETWPELWAMYEHRMTDIKAIVDRLLLRGKIMETWEMNLDLPGHQTSKSWTYPFHGVEGMGVGGGSVIPTIVIPGPMVS